MAYSVECVEEVAGVPLALKGEQLATAAKFPLKTVSMSGRVEAA